MPSFDINGLDDLLLSMEEIAQLPDGVVDEMLQVQVDEFVAAQQAEAQAKGLVDSGDMVESIKGTHPLSNGSSRYIDVYPQGIHHTYHARRGSAAGTKKRYAREKGETVNVPAGEVAFIQEYGARNRNISPTQFIRVANEKASPKALEKARAVYERFLSSKGL